MILDNLTKVVLPGVYFLLSDIVAYCSVCKTLIEFLNRVNLQFMRYLFENVNVFMWFVTSTMHSRPTCDFDYFSGPSIIGVYFLSIFAFEVESAGGEVAWDGELSE